jgi:uncharacterized membrane protein
MERLPDGRLKATGRARDFVIAVDRAVYGFARNWVFWLCLILLVYVSLPFLAPALMEAGYDRAARVIYAIYGPMCHQLGSRSWFLFGEQWAYPRDQFMSLTGVDLNSMAGIDQARAFLGDDTFGYKVAFCQRDVAIYGAMFLAGLIYAIPAVQQRLQPMPWWLWLIIGIGPIGLDGFSQLLSQFPFSAMPGAELITTFLPERESTPFLRTFTGALFGVSNVWLAFPYLKSSFEEMVIQTEAKLAKVDAAKG